VRRVILLCAVCVFIFSMKAGLSLATVLNLYKNRDGVPLAHPDSSTAGATDFALNRYVFDVIVYGAVELVPSWMVLAITHRRRYRPLPGKGSTRSSDETRSSSRQDDVPGWPAHLEDEFAAAQAAYPPPSPVFPAYGTNDRSDASMGGLPIEGSAGALSASSVASGSMRSGYYSASSYPGPGAHVMSSSAASHDFTQSYGR